MKNIFGEKSDRFNISKDLRLQVLPLPIIRIFETPVVTTGRRLRADRRRGRAFLPGRIILAQLWFFGKGTQQTLTAREEPGRCDSYLMTVGEKTVAEERECSEEE